MLFRSREKKKKKKKKGKKKKEVHCLHCELFTNNTLSEVNRSDVRLHY